MARKRKGGRKAGGTNKSQAVREYLASHPDAGPNAVREALAEKGIQISTSLASVIKYGSNKKKGKPGRPKGSGRGRGARARRGSSGSSLNIDALVDAKKMAERMGGIEAARAALELLAKLA